MPSLDLSTLAARALTLDERLAGGLPPGGEEADDALVAARLERWSRSAARGDAALFARRLALDGLDEAAARRALAPAKHDDAFPLPAWTATLAAVGRAAIDGARESPAVGTGKRLPRGCDTLPFAHILAPFLAVARDLLAPRVAGVRHLLDEAAWLDLEAGLLRRLAVLLTPTLEVEFGLHLARRQSSLERLRIRAAAARGESPVPTAGYDAFVARLLSDGFSDFFHEYAALARLAATTVDRWVDTGAELVEHLAADLPALRLDLAGGAPLGPVTALAADQSDLHDGGRSVAVLTFACGARLVYKPKDVGIEAAFAELLSWCSGNGAPLPLRAPRVVARAGYGWVEHIGQRPCRDEAEARRYYRRAGMLVALTYLLDATDCHGENLIAAGEDPVLIDAETLLHPQPASTESEPLAFRQLWESVLRSGLLPRWEFSADRRTVLDVSGLGGIDEGPALIREPRFRHVNTDAMEKELVYGTRRPPANVPRLDGRTLAPETYADELVDGFRGMYDFLASRADALADPGGPLAALSRQRVRFIFRMTRAYALLLERSLRPEVLRDGIERSLELDFLSRTLLDGSAAPGLWPIVAAERAALERQDIPAFGVRADGVDLPLGPGAGVPGLFPVPGAERVRARLARLDAADRERQVELIRGALAARSSGRPPAARTGAEAPPDPCACEPLDRDALLAEAMRIADGLARRASRGADGSAGWIGLEHLVDARRFQLNPIGPSLYDGTGGVALFLSALEAVTGGAGHRTLALAALRPLQRLARESATAPLLVAELGLGGAVGIGSLVHALTRCAGLLGGSEPLEEPLADARSLARRLTPRDVDEDRALDVVAGTAGLVLGLLDLHAATGDAHALELARHGGRHLLARRSGPEGLRSWATLDGRHLAGFGHGAAGIAYTLLRLHAVAPDDALLDAAREAIAWERSVFVPAAGSWPDLRAVEAPGAPSTFLHGWCGGAPGIGLARLGGLPLLDTPAVRDDLDAALRAVLARGPGGLDHVCCGTMGGVELLLEAARRLGRADLDLEARRRAATVVSRASRHGGYLVAGDVPGAVYNPGLFQGVAGIGTTLLRLAAPGRVPSVLLRE